MSEAIVKKAKDGLRGARAALVKGEKPAAYIAWWGALSAAQRSIVCEAVPGFAAGHIAVCGGVKRLAERRACEAEVRAR